MLYDRILVTHGELSIKGKNRKVFKDALHRNLKFKLKDLPALEFEITRDRFYILLHSTDASLVTAKLDQVFGLHSYSLCAKTNNEIDQIKALGLAIMNEKHPESGTFKVETKRADKSFEMESGQVSRSVGGYILAHTDHLTVDVHQPDVELKVEIRREGTFVMAGKTLGLGGFPVGSAGRGLLMISGGIDSPVAGYLMQKRGVEIEAIHFASPPYTSERSLQKVRDLMVKNAAYAPKGGIKLHVVAFTKLQEEIHKMVPDRYEMTVMRRMMYRISEGVAKKRNILVMGNGESLGQVASQTLASMHAINAVTSMPIIRPLATYDKLEIIDIAKKIDTYETSILPFEDCCTIFVPKSPVTNPTICDCEAHEALFEWEPLVAECIETVTTEFIKADGNQGVAQDIADEIDDLL